MNLRHLTPAAVTALSAAVLLSAGPAQGTVLTRTVIKTGTVITTSPVAPSPVSDDMSSTLPRTSAPAPALAPPARAGVLGTNIDSAIATRLQNRSSDPRLGTSFSAKVYDVSAKAPVWSKRSSLALLPASTNKVVTAYVAVKSLGAAWHIPTTVFGHPTSSRTIYLKGSADPSLTSARLTQLAAATATSLRAKGVTGVAVKVDDSLFPAPTNAAGWKSTYIPGSVAPVRALVVDSHNVLDTSMDAGQVFANALKARGVAVWSLARERTPAGSPLVTRTWSQPLSTLVGDMLNASQNDYAEALFRLAAIKRGYGATWRGATANAAAVLKANGIPTTGWAMLDGSGLSRSDRMPVATLDATLRSAVLTPELAAVFMPTTSLPVSGVSGTLRTRYRTWPTACAKTVLHAKTGTLADVHSLAGVSYGKDGRTRVFTLIVNGKTDKTATRAALDLMATTTTGCY